MTDTPTPETPAELAARILAVFDKYVPMDVAAVAGIAVNRLSTLAASSTAPEAPKPWLRVVDDPADFARVEISLEKRPGEYLLRVPRRRPLTIEKIRELWIEHGLDECDPEGFTRAIERAHGITEASA